MTLKRKREPVFKDDYVRKVYNRVKVHKNENFIITRHWLETWLQANRRLQFAVTWHDLKKSRTQYDENQTLRIKTNARVSIYIRPFSMVVMLWKLVAEDAIIDVDKSYCSHHGRNAIRDDMYEFYFKSEYQGYYGYDKLALHVSYPLDYTLPNCGVIHLYGSFTKEPHFMITSRSKREYRMRPNLTLQQNPFYHLYCLMKTFKVKACTFAFGYKNWFFSQAASYKTFLDQVLDPGFDREKTIYPSEIKNTWYVLDAYESMCLRILLRIEEMSSDLRPRKENMKKLKK